LNHGLIIYISERNGLEKRAELSSSISLFSVIRRSAPKVPVFIIFFAIKRSVPSIVIFFIKRSAPNVPVSSIFSSVFLNLPGSVIFSFCFGFFSIFSVRIFLLEVSLVPCVRPLPAVTLHIFSSLIDSTSCLALPLIGSRSPFAPCLLRERPAPETAGLVSFSPQPPLSFLSR